MLDPGHGGRDPGAVGNGLREKDLTLNIARRVKKILEGYEVSVRMTRDSDIYVSLSGRAKKANDWKANYFSSIHINAGGGTGFESFIWNGKVSQKTITVRKAIHDQIVTRTKKHSRGRKRANFAVLRLTSMPASLTECFFIDNKTDASNLKNSSFLNLIATGHANGLVSAYNLTPKKVWDKPAVTVPKKPVHQKGVETLAREVIAGKHGTGAERKKILGNRYDAVQKRVNDILKGGSSRDPVKGVTTLAREVIRGDHGDGAERKRKLGNRYAEVQRRVNQLLKG